jgi:hypothetical protein
VLAAVGLLVANRVGRVGRVGRVAVATVAAVAVVAGLGGSAAFAVATAGTPHTGSIPTAGPGVSFPSHFALGGPGPLVVPPTGGTALSPTAVFPVPGGGLLDARRVNDQTLAALMDNASDYVWVAAISGANNAAGYQLATQRPVMPLGGFNGTDPSPTLAQFQRYVADGKIHWFIGGGLGAPAALGFRTSEQIAYWVQQNFPAQTIGGVTMYDLTDPVR